jgi:hypothetical protein
MEPIKTHHYKRIPALIRRDQGDQPKDLFERDLSERLTSFEFYVQMFQDPCVPPIRP